MNCLAWLYLLMFANISNFARAKRTLTVDLQNFTCILVDPSYGKLYCVVHRRRPNPCLYVSFMLAKTEPEFNIHFFVDIIKSDNSVIKLANTKFDGCKFLSSMYSNNIYGKFLKRVQQHSNLPRKCPIPGNKLYEIRNYTEYANEYPPAVPEFTFRLTMKILKNDNVVAIIFFIASTSY